MVLHFPRGQLAPKGQCDRPSHLAARKEEEKVKRAHKILGEK